jgi:hypothetical protein
MTPSLNDPYGKLARAEEHLETLDRECHEFMRDDPYAFVCDKDTEPGLYLYRLKVHRIAPVRLGILVGDVVHNLRSCLDHLAWQLACVSTTTPHPRTEFPIFKDAGPGRRCFDPDGLKKIQSLPSAAQEIIEAEQPYHREKPDEDPLWLLQELSNVDKHRIILVPAPHSHSAIGTFSDSWSFQKADAVLYLGRLNDGDVVVRMKSPPRDEEPDVTPTFTIGVDLTEHSVMDIQNVLSRIRNSIRYDLLPQFARFF